MPGTYGAKPPPETTEVTPTTPRRVLLVDDVADLRLSVKMILELDGRFEVVGEAGNGAKGIELAEELQPDLVLLDLSMPKMDGLEALPEILQVAPDAKVIIFSGFVEGRLGPRVRELGGLGYIEKGIEPADLVAAIVDLMETGQASPPGTQGAEVSDGRWVG